MQLWTAVGCSHGDSGHFSKSCSVRPSSFRSVGHVRKYSSYDMEVDASSTSAFGLRLKLRRRERSLSEALSSALMEPEL